MYIWTCIDCDVNEYSKSAAMTHKCGVKKEVVEVAEIVEAKEQPKPKKRRTRRKKADK